VDIMGRNGRENLEKIVHKQVWYVSHKCGLFTTKIKEKLQIILNDINRYVEGYCDS
jgi:hypothetical protein